MLFTEINAAAAASVSNQVTAIGTLLVHCWYSLDRHVTIGTPMVIFAVFTVF